MLLRYMFTELMLPPGINLILLLLALLLWRANRVIAVLLAVISLTSLFVVAMPGVKARLFQGLEVYDPVDLEALAESQVQPQAIVVLAGGILRDQSEYGHAIPSDASMHRLLYGAKLHRDTGLPMLLTGGNGAGAEISEAEAMARLLKELSIEPRWLETASLNTWENATYSAKYLKADQIDTVLLVTDAWHMPRAVFSFEQQGIKVIPAPMAYLGGADDIFTQWIPNALSFYQSSRAIREYLGMLAYRWGQESP